MTAFIALLRAVNVGGTGKLPMSDLKAMGEAAGYARVRTHIASGNLLFTTDADEATVKATLEAALAAYAGRPVGVLVRTAAEMAAVAAANPFPQAPPNRVMALFLDTPPAPDFLAGITGQRGEEIQPGRRELYIHYPNGMADTRLTIPAARDGTARNMNSVAKLAALALE